MYAAISYDYCESNRTDILNKTAWSDECSRENNRTRQTCAKPCAATEVCSANADNTYSCVSNIGCTCAANQDCSISYTSANVKTYSCVCKDGFKKDQTTGNCIDASLCGGVRCDGVNHTCSPVQTNSGFKDACICLPGTIQNVKTGACDPPASQTVFSGCLKCNDNNKENCGCNGENEECTGPDETTGRCSCRSGCSLQTGKCKPVIIIPVPTPAVCQAFGDVHYGTLDGKYIDDQTQCDTVIFKGSGTLVHVRQSQCAVGWPQSCAKGVAVQTSEGNIIAVEDTDPVALAPVVHVNGAATTTASTSAGTTTITMSSYQVDIVLGNGIVVKYRRRYAVQVIVPGKFRNTNTTGVCGNFNGDASDDGFKEGDFSVGNSILFSSTNQDCFVNKRSIQQNDPANVDPNCDLKAGDACSEVLNLDQTYPNCSALVDYSSYYSACILDYCVLGDAIVKASVDAASSRCSFMNNIYTAYRTNSTICSGADCDTYVPPPDVPVPSAVPSPSALPVTEPAPQGELNFANSLTLSIPSLLAIILFFTYLIS